MRKLPMTALTLSSALAGAIALSAAGLPAQAAGDQVKCYGISKAGENDCANQAAGHSCAGHSKESYNGQDFKAVTKAQCMEMMGKTEPFDGMNPAKKS